MFPFGVIRLPNFALFDGRGWLFRIAEELKRRALKPECRDAIAHDIFGYKNPPQ